MKTRESGMPDEGMWRSFFDPEAILAALGLDESVHDAVDFGSGYGTFAIPAARRIRGTLHGFDIEAEMVAECARRARGTHPEPEITLSRFRGGRHGTACRLGGFRDAVQYPSCRTTFAAIT